MTTLLPPHVLANIRAAVATRPGTFPDTLVLETQDAPTKTDYGADSAPTYTPVPGGTIAGRIHPTRTEMVVKPDNSLIYVTRCRFSCGLDAPVATGQSVLLGTDRYTLLNTDVVREWSTERIVDCEKDTTTG